MLLRRGFALEYATLAWNVAGIVVLAVAAVAARSVALAGFGLDSLIEIGASTVVIWELSGAGEQRQRRGLRLIGFAFAALAAYLLVQSTVVLAVGYHPGHSRTGIIWTAVTAAAMFALAAGKARTGRALDNPVLRTEGRVTMIDGVLAVTVLLGLILNAALGWWWADPAAGYVLVYYAGREVRQIFAAPDGLGGRRRAGRILGLVQAEDLAGRGEQAGPERRRLEDRDLVTEAGQPVYGRPLVLERQRHDPPAVLAGRCRRLQRGPGGRTEDLGKRGQCRWRRREPDLNLGSAGLELGRPAGPEGGEVEVRRPPEGVGQDAGAEHTAHPVHPDIPAPGHRHQVPDPRLAHQAERPDNARAAVTVPGGPVPKGQLAAARAWSSRTSESRRSARTSARLGVIADIRCQ